MRRLRIPVATVLRLLASGKAEHEILFDYPDLETEDIRECLRFAAASAMERERLCLTHLEILIDNALPPGLADLLVVAGLDAAQLDHQA